MAKTLYLSLVPFFHMIWGIKPVTVYRGGIVPVHRLGIIVFGIFIIPLSRGPYLCAPPLAIPPHLPPAATTHLGGQLAANRIVSRSVGQWDGWPVGRSVG